MTEQVPIRRRRHHRRGPTKRFLLISGPFFFLAAAFLLSAGVIEVIERTPAASQTTPTLAEERLATEDVGPLHEPAGVPPEATAQLGSLVGSLIDDSDYEYGPMAGLPGAEAGLTGDRLGFAPSGGSGDEPRQGLGAEDSNSNPVGYSIH